MGEAAGIIVAAGLVTMLAVIAVGDARTRLIPNRQVVVVALLVAVMLTLHGAGLRHLGWHVVTGIVVLGAGWLAFAAGAMGGGDVKLLAVLAVLAGPERIGVLLLVTTFAGAGQAVWAILRRGRAARAEGVPYGVSIALGGMAVALLMVAG